MTNRTRLTLTEVRDRATITVEEWADLHGIGRTTAYAAVRAGEVPTIRVGRRVLIPVPALLRSLGDDGSQQSATSASA